MNAISHGTNSFPWGMYSFRSKIPIVYLTILHQHEYLFCGFLDVSNQVRSVLLLLQPRVDHLGARDVLLGVLEVDVQGLVVPYNPLLDVGLSVSEPGRLSGFPPEHPVEVGPLLVLAPGLHGVALGTCLGEDTLAFVSTHYL